MEPEVLDVYPKEESEDDTGEVTYDVAYENNEKPGTATLVITGNGNFTGVIRKEFTIEKGIQEHRTGGYYTYRRGRNPNRSQRSDRYSDSCCF